MLFELLYKDMLAFLLKSLGRIMESCSGFGGEAGGVDCARRYGLHRTIMTQLVQLRSALHIPDASGTVITARCQLAAIRAE